MGIMNLCNLFQSKSIQTEQYRAELFYYFSDCLLFILRTVDGFDTQINIERFFIALNSSFNSLLTPQAQDLYRESIVLLIGVCCERSNLLLIPKNTLNMIMNFLLWNLIAKKSDIIENIDYISQVLREAEGGKNKITYARRNTDFSNKDYQENQNIQKMMDKSYEMLALLIPSLESITKFLVGFTTDISIGKTLWQNILDHMMMKLQNSEEVNTLQTVILRYIFTKTTYNQADLLFKKVFIQEENDEATIEFFIANSDMMNSLNEYKMIIISAILLKKQYFKSLVVSLIY